MVMPFPAKAKQYAERRAREKRIRDMNKLIKSVEKGKNMSEKKLVVPVDDPVSSVKLSVKLVGSLTADLWIGGPKDYIFFKNELNNEGAIRSYGNTILLQEDGDYELSMTLYHGRPSYDILMPAGATRSLDNKNNGFLFEVVKNVETKLASVISNNGRACIERVSFTAKRGDTITIAANGDHYNFLIYAGGTSLVINKVDRPDKSSVFGNMALSGNGGSISIDCAGNGCVSTTASAGGSWSFEDDADVKTVNINKPSNRITAHDIVSVQPMMGPVGGVQWQSEPPKVVNDMSGFIESLTEENLVTLRRLLIKEGNAIRLNDNGLIEANADIFGDHIITAGRGLTKIDGKLCIDDNYLQETIDADAYEVLSDWPEDEEQMTREEFAESVAPFVTVDYIRQHILKMSDEEILQADAVIKEAARERMAELSAERKKKKFKQFELALKAPKPRRRLRSDKSYIKRRAQLVDDMIWPIFDDVNSLKYRGGHYTIDNLLEDMSKKFDVNENSISLTFAQAVESATRWATERSSLFNNRKYTIETAAKCTIIKRGRFMF